MNDFISFISQGRWYESARIIGYSHEEIKKLERLYEIKISGNLYSFLNQIGRSSGGLLGDDVMIMYKDYFSVRNHVVMQECYREYLIDYYININMQKNVLQELPLFFAIEGETQYYYINTNSKDPEKVYCFDSNQNVVKETRFSFVQYLSHLVRLYGGYEPKIICQGEMIVI